MAQTACPGPTAQQALRSRTNAVPGVRGSHDTGGPQRRTPANTRRDRESRRSASRVRKWLAGAEIAVMGAALAVAGHALHRAYVDGQQPEAVVHGVALGGHAIGGLPGEAVEGLAAAVGEASLDRPMTLVAGQAETTTTARALGAVPTPASMVEPALAVGRSGDLLADLRTRAAAAQAGIDLPIGYRFAEHRALEQLLALAPDVERPSLPTRLDLEARKVLAAERGSALLAYDSLSNVAVGLARGADRIELVVQPKPPVEDPLSKVAEQLDVSIVLGSFDTPYSTDPEQNDRNHNLEVGAAAVDGTVLMPNETFSFNDIVGDRTAEAGYRYATGIAAGQLIDVLGGGICQVSSTMFGAAFFAGLEVVDARPHSRPSSYVDMGLDSTVAYPSLDLKLRNPYDFPVVLHMTVSLGKVRAEVLGPRRPYQIAFERELQEVMPYETVWRSDDRLRAGTENVVQRGRRGFRLERRRKFYQGGDVVKTETSELLYPPTTEILRRGTNPTGEIPETKKRVPLRDPAPNLRIMQ